MCEQDISARFRRTPIAAAFVVAFVSACGGGGSGGGGESTSDASESEKRAIASTTATQTAAATTAARTGSESASELDDEESLDELFGGATSSANGPMTFRDRVQHATDSGALAQALTNETCEDGGSISSEDVSEDGMTGVRVVATNCTVLINETDPDTGVEIDASLLVDGTQTVLSNTSNVKVESDNFLVDVDFYMSEVRDDSGNLIMPEIGPIEANVTSDGGYSAAMTSNTFDMTANWALGFGLACSGEGFDFGMEATDLEVSALSDGIAWDNEINGSIAWSMAADAWNNSYSEDVTYTTVRDIRVPVDGGNPVDGLLDVNVGGTTVMIEFVDQNTVSVDGTDYTYDELRVMHEEELGADLEEELLGRCIGEF